MDSRSRRSTIRNRSKFGKVPLLVPQVRAFVWDASFETRIGEVDSQHRRLVDLINAIGDLLAQGSGEGTPEPIADELCAELLAYTEYHFAEEERLMQAEAVDPQHRTAHTRAHDDFRRYVLELSAHSPSTRISQHSLLNYLVHWLTYHILGSDQSMARQIWAIRGGVTPTEAFEREGSDNDPSVRLLLRSVGELFDVLSHRNRELLDLAESLEAQVAERTKALFAANEELCQLVATVEEMAMTDSLTELPNRRCAMQRLETAWATFTRYQGHGLSCLLIDADGFKEVNDRFGHQSGDIVLQRLARTLRCTARSSDEVYRLGGDEFLVLCPETELGGASQLAERLRDAVARLRVELAGGVWHGSISVGVSTVDSDVDSVEELLRTSDAALYAAKRAGRNRVAVAEPAPEAKHSGVLRTSSARGTLAQRKSKTRG